MFSVSTKHSQTLIKNQTPTLSAENLQQRLVEEVHKGCGFLTWKDVCADTKWSLLHGLVFVCCAEKEMAGEDELLERKSQQEAALIFSSCI